jgi:Uma2 family endonuclease
MSELAELQQKLSAEEIVRRYVALETDPRFTDFAGKIEINEYGDLLVNAASRPHVLLQKRLGAFLERKLGGEAVTEMPVRVPLSGGTGFKLRVPDISWSGIAGFFEGPPEQMVLTHPAELCVEIKSDSNTLKELFEKRDELLAAGALEVWLVFPEHRRAEFYGREGRLPQSSFAIDLEEFWRSQAG